MRLNVAREDKDLNDHVFLMQGSLWWDEARPIPIYFGYTGETDFPIGYATDVKREGYAITAEITWRDKEVKEYSKLVDLENPNFFIFNVKSHEFKGFRFVEWGHLTEIQFHPNPGFPRTEL